MTSDDSANVPSAQGERLRIWLGPLFAVLVFGAAIWLLYDELRAHSWRQIVAAVQAVPQQRIILAIALTMLNYLVLAGYDALAVRYLRHPLSAGRILLGSFVGYTMSYNFGWMLGGPTARYRLYSNWGFSAFEIVRLLAILTLTFWAGLLGLAGLVFVLDPLPIPQRLHVPLETTFWLGPVFLTVLAAYLTACTFMRRPLSWRGWEIKLPPLGLAVLQVAVAASDLLIAAGVLYVLLPAGVDISYWRFMNVFLLGVVAVIFSHVPGGVGVFELVVLTLVAPSDSSGLVGTLLVYRGVYYLLPLIGAVGLLSGSELLARGQSARRVAKRVGSWVPHVAPRILAVGCFLAGIILLFSSATPAEHDRLHWLRQFLPLSVLEASHFFGSIIGVVMLILAHGIQRRLDSAYWVAIGLLITGIAASLLKGFDFEEAIYLTLLVAALIPCRKHFYRHSRLLAERFSPPWILALALVLGCTAWLMMFTHKHVEYSNDLWWQFAFNRDAPRALRASAGVLGVVLFVALTRLLQAKHKPPAKPTPEDVATARDVALRSPRVYAQLVSLGDKSILFSEDHSAFLMFGGEGRSWVTLGDPIGPDEAAEELAWRFREICDEQGNWPVFYQVETDRLPLYIDLGLSILKLGEEARVPLAEFKLEGNARKSLRHTCAKVEQDGCTFELVEPPHSAELLRELEGISNDWLQRKKTREKRFSLGFFEPRYISLSPLGLVRRENRIVAFANILRSGEHEEISIDLMRFSASAPSGTMDYLFARLMLRGREEGFHWFNLGMAPLAGVEGHRLAPAWNRIAEIVYRHGEHFYNFQGLRAYKDKFDPVWEPKFLASPGGLWLPIILTNVATLISGGAKGLVGK